MRKHLIAVLLLVGCASWKPLPYSPKPLSEEPADAFMRLLMTARMWRPTKIDVKPKFAVMTYVVNGQYGGITTVTLPFEEISRVDLLSNKGQEFDVDVLDKKGERLYRYLASDEAKAQEFVDVMVALTSPKVVEPASSPAFSSN